LQLIAKTYLTKEEKLECLKYKGKAYSANTVTFFTVNELPPLFQETISINSSFFDK